jgi:hypothetical protein
MEFSISAPSTTAPGPINYRGRHRRRSPGFPGPIMARPLTTQARSPAEVVEGAEPGLVGVGARAPAQAGSRHVGQAVGLRPGPSSAAATRAEGDRRRASGHRGMQADAIPGCGGRPAVLGVTEGVTEQIQHEDCVLEHGLDHRTVAAVAPNGHEHNPDLTPVDWSASR